MNENLCSFLLRAPKKFRHNNSSCLFQEFLDECEQACRGVHDREFEPTEASEISRPSVSDGSDNDDVFGRNATETSRLSLSGILEFEADKDLVPGNLSEKTFDMFSIFARHLHSLTQLERTEILQTLTNISIYNAYCACANFLWRFPYELSEKAEMAKDEGIDLSVILLNQAPGVLMISPCVLMVSLQCTEHPPVYS